MSSLENWDGGLKMWFLLKLSSVCYMYVHVQCIIIQDTRHNWTVSVCVCCCIQALLSQGSDVVYSYGHHTTSVRLPQSMTVLRKVQCTCI